MQGKRGPMKPRLPEIFSGQQAWGVSFSLIGLFLTVMLQLSMARLSGLQKSNGMQLHKCSRLSQPGNGCYQRRKFEIFSKHMWMLTIPPLSLSQRPCFHCPLCMPVNHNPGSKLTVSGHTGGNLLEPGWGRTFSDLAPLVH